MERRRLVPVMAMVAVLLGSGGCGSGGGLPAVSGPTSPKLELDASEMRYTPAKIAVAAGDITVVLRNVGVVHHDLRVEDKPRLFAEAVPGQTSTTTWQLGKGRYRIYCSVTGHRAAGMEGILEVR
jgi:plastocyanin